MAINVFLVKVTATDQVTDIYRNQRAATLKADSDPLVEAVQGAVSWPDDAEIGWFHINRTVVPEPTLAGFPALQEAARAWVDQLIELRVGVAEVGHIFPSSVIASAHDWIAWAEHGGNRIMRSTSWSVDLRIAWSKSAGSGPLNVTTALEFLGAVVGAGAAPTSAVSWADPATGLAWTMKDSIANTLSEVTPSWASDPDVIDLSAGKWPENLTA